MAFDLRGMLTAVQTIVAALPTVIATEAEVGLAIPSSVPARINAFVVLGAATPRDSDMGGQDWEPNVHVIFAYRVAGAPAGAELVIADLVVELVDAFIGDNGDPTVGGTVDPGRITLDMSDATLNRLYSDIAGSEARFYPVTITGFQQRTVV